MYPWLAKLVETLRRDDGQRDSLVRHLRPLVVGLGLDLLPDQRSQTVLRLSRKGVSEQHHRAQGA